MRLSRPCYTASVTPRWPRLALCALIVLSSPGAPAWQAFAAGGQTWDPKKGKMVSPDDAQSAAPDAAAVEADAASADAAGAAPGSAAALIQALSRNPNIGADERRQAVDYLKRYGSALDNGDEETRRALEDAAKQLKDQKTEPSLALAHMFEGTSTAARQAEQAGNVTQILKETGDKTVGRVISTVAGKTIYEFENNKVGTNTTLQVIRKPDPKHPGQQTVETVIREEVKGAATEKRILYNRRLHDLLHSLKKLYYDQCGLVRKINNGELRIADSKCGDNGKEEVLGHHDPDLTEEARAKIQALYEKNRRGFPKKLAEYLDKLDSLRASGQLASLTDWKEAEEMQRLAMGFYQDHQLAQYQRIVIQELVQYFSSATGVQAKQKKGDDAVDATAKKLEEFQEQLDDYKRGDMEGYGALMKIIGYTKLDENDRKYVTPAVLSFASEAFASVAFAARAQEQLLNPKAKLTGPEQDALI